MRRWQIFAALLVALGVAVGLWLMRAPASTRTPSALAPGTGSADSERRAQACRGRVAGQIVDENGSALADAQVTIDTTTTRSDARGGFELRGLADGEHRLELSATGFELRGPPGLQRATLTLAETGCLDDLRLVLRRPNLVSGQVRAGDRPVPAQIGVVYLNAEGLRGRHPPFALDALVNSGPDGRFALNGLPAGRLRVVAESAEFAAAESREIYLRGGEEVTGLIIDVRPAGQLHGVVVDPEGRGLAGAVVVVHGGELAHALRASADASGGFALTGIPVGTVQLRAEARGYRSASLDAVEVTREAGDALRLVLEPARGLFGRVLEPDGQGASPAWVLRRGGRRGKLLRSAADGSFAWPEEPAQPARGLATSPFFGSSEWTPLNPGEEAELQLTAGGHIDGTVVDMQARPVTAYQLAIEDFQVTGPAPYRASIYPDQQVTRSDGRFAIGSLRPGRYALRVLAEGHAPAGSGFVEVRAGQRTGGVVIRLQGGASVEGQVRSDEGEGLAGARIVLFDPSSPFRPQQTLSRDDGSYSLHGVAAGRRSLKVSARGFVTQIAAGLEVPGRGTLERDVVLSRAHKGDAFAFHGIGAVLMKHGDHALIRETIEGHAAATYGLRPGDRILAVDREPVADLRLDQIVERIRGEEGVPVELEIDRPDEGLMTVEIERGQVVVRERGS